MKLEIRYCITYSEALIQKLDEAGVRYNVSDMCVIFYLYEGNPVTDALRPYLDTLDHGPILKSLIYTEKEREEAQWLFTRTTCMKVEPPYHRNFNFRRCPGDRCFYREVTLPFWGSKPVKWGKNHFFYAAYELGYNELFCNDQAKEILDGFGLPLEYYPVVHERTGNEIPNVHYMKPVYTLPPEAIDVSNLRIQSRCSKCGQTTYELQDRDQLCVRKCFLNPQVKIYATPNIFGPGGTEPAMIISQEVYQMLKGQKMDRGLLSVPIVLK